MNLSDTFKVTLKDNSGASYVQYMDAGKYGMDAAISLAKKSFQANLYQLADKNQGSESQKVCDKTKLCGRLMFGFGGGHVTMDVTGKTIVEAVAEAEQHKFAEGEKVVEITSPMYYRDEYPNKETYAPEFNKIISIDSDSCSLYLRIVEGTDMDDRFKAWDIDERCYIVVNGWLFS